MVQNSSMDWEDVRLFLALAREGSARSAAEVLGISHSTMSRRADQLEDGLGTRLFDRDVSGYRLTAAGETLLAQAEKAEDALITAERQLQGRDAQLSGEIRVTMPDVIAIYLLIDDLAEFARRYPEIDLNILLSYDVYDISRREADIAIRFIGGGRSPPEELVGRKLVTIRSCYYASPAYLEEHDPWAKDTDARFIGWENAERYPWWVKESPFPHVPSYGNLNNGVMQVEAAKAGMGIAVLPCYMGDGVEGLRRVPRTEPYENYDIWLLSHPDLRDAARLRTFRRFIVAAFDRKKDLLEGCCG